MKKLISVLLVAAAFFTFAAGCSSKGNGDPAPEDTASGGAAVDPFTGKYVADAEYIKDKIGNDNVLFIDARGEDAAKKGTLEGAIAVNWQMFASVSDGSAGDEMWGTILPVDDLEDALGTTGISPDKEIIIFGSAQNGWGDDGRIAWELIAAGFSDVKIANGDFEALKDAGIPSAGKPAEFVPAEVSITSIDSSHIINTDELAADYDEYKIVDVRDDKEYNGEVLYGEAAGGHLPGAIHIPFAELFNEDTTLKSNDEIKKIFKDAGLEPGDKIVTYCTAGIRSAYMQLILEMCEYENSKNYDESFYRWCAVRDVE